MAVRGIACRRASRRPPCARQLSAIFPYAMRRRPIATSPRPFLRGLSAESKIPFFAGQMSPAQGPSLPVAVPVRSRRASARVSGRSPAVLTGGPGAVQLATAAPRGSQNHDSLTRCYHDHAMRFWLDRAGGDGREPRPEHREPRLLASRCSTAPRARWTTSSRRARPARSSSAATRSKSWSAAVGQAAQGHAHGQGRRRRSTSSSRSSSRCCRPGDVIIDGGNTHFTDTERRTKYVESKGLLYIGTGVSGGEEGRAQGSEHDARRQRRGLAARQADLPGHLRQGRPEAATSPAANGSARAAPATTSRWSTTASSTATCS